MPLFSHLIFDLDGTLVNSKVGLYNSLTHMLDQMELTIDRFEHVDLNQLIGPPIQEGLKNILGFDRKQVDLGVKLFREYYSQQGLYEGEVYPGIAELLEELHRQGCRLFVATSKKNDFTPVVLRHFELDHYLTDFEGSGDGGKHTKAELITRLMDRNQLQPSPEIVMIGDTKFDIVGGKANEISTIGVGYGFGNSEEMHTLHPDYFAEDVEELAELLI